MMVQLGFHSRWVELMLGKSRLVFPKLTNVSIHVNNTVTPQTRGSVDYPSTRKIQVDVGLPDATSENRAESPLYGELYPNTVPAYTCPKQSNIIPTRVKLPLGPIIQYSSQYIQTINPTISNSYKSSNIFHSYTTYIKILEF